jgi:tetratricopeptide (TPR) repeat protein
MRAVLVILLAVVPALAGPADAGDLYRAGKELLDAGELDAAQAKFEAALRQDPDFFLAHHGLGNVFAARRDYDAAARRFREAIRRKPDFPEGHNSLGVVLAAAGKPVEAATAFERAIALRPGYTNARLNLAGTQLAAGRADLAEDSAREALSHDAKSGEARYFLARLAATRKAHAEALRLLDEAIVLDPANSAYHLARGETLLALDRVEDAAGAFRKATETDPKNGQAFFRLGVVSTRLGDWPAAATAFAKAEELLPRSAAASGNLGVALFARYAQTKDRATLESAIGALERSLARNPSQPDLIGKLSEARTTLASLPPAPK